MDLKILKRLGGLPFISPAQKMDLFWLATGQGVAFVIGILSTKLLTSMGDEPYGIYSLILSVQGLISLAFYGPMEQGYLKFFYEYKKENRERLYKVLFVRYLMAGAFALGLVLTGAALGFHQTAAFSTPTAFLTGLFVTLSLTNVPLISFANLKKERKYNALMVIAERSLYIIVILLLFMKVGRTLSNALAAFCVSLAIVIVFRVRSLKPGPLGLAAEERPMARAINKKIALFALPFMVWGVAAWLQSYSERWVLNQVLTTSAVGHYALWLMISNVCIVVPYGLISQFIIPVIYEKTADVRDAERYEQGLDLIRQFFLVIGMLVIVTAVALSIVGRSVILVLSNETYLDHWYILIFVCIGMGLFSLGQILNLYGMVMNKPKIYLGPKIASGCLAVGTYYFCIRRYQIDGLIPALLIINVFYLTTIVWVNRRLLREHRAGQQ